jgi:mRNA-degrading endonuclease YafQ of YafQ-DinJ toxin-antitoxin module
MGKKSNLKKVKREEVKEENTKKIVEEPLKTSKSEALESQLPQMREVHIQTDGTSIRIVKNETAGQLELLALLQALIGNLTSPK